MPKSKEHPFVGKYVICRGKDSGVHTGVLQSAEGRSVFLQDARRIYEWKGAFTLNSVALFGVSSAMMPAAVPQIYIADCCELIPTSEASEKCLRKLPTHKP